MKIEIRRQALLFALEKVEKALAQRDEVLSGIKLSAIGGTVLLLEATNNNIYVYTQIEGNLKIEEQGEILLSGKHFTSIIKKLSGGLVIIETKNNDAIIKSSSSRFKLRLLDVERFPERREREYSKAIKLKTDLFKKLVSKTIHATSDKRVNLSGVNFKTEKNKLIVCGTDSFRIAKCEADIEMDEKIDIIIPAESLQELIKIIDEKEITLRLGQTHARFEFGDTQFETRLIADSFPNVDIFFENEKPISAVFDKKKLINAIERTTILLSANDAEIIKLKLFANKLFLSIQENEIGAANEEINAENVNGEIELALNSKFLIDALKTYDSEKIRISSENPLKPIEICDTAGFKNNHIILPIQAV